MLLTVAMLLAGNDVWAETDQSRFELTFFGAQGFGGTFETESGERISLDDDASLGIAFDIRESSNTQWEIFYLRQKTSADTSALLPLEPSIDTDIHYLQGGGTYQGTGERVRPYLAGTAGATRISPVGSNTESDTFVSLSFGGGLQLRPAERLGFRLEARVFGTIINSSSKIYCGSRSGEGRCRFELEGDMLWQVHAFVGVTFRF